MNTANFAHRWGSRDESNRFNDEQMWHDYDGKEAHFIASDLLRGIFSMHTRDGAENTDMTGMGGAGEPVSAR
jgi:hypothetical protein